MIEGVAKRHEPRELDRQRDEQEDQAPVARGALTAQQPPAWSNSRRRLSRRALLRSLPQWFSRQLDPLLGSDAIARAENARALQKMHTGRSTCTPRARLTSPVEQPTNPEAPVIEAAVVEMKALTRAVSSGPDDADEATGTLAASTAADRLSVVAQKVRPRVHEPRW